MPTPSDRPNVGAGGELAKDLLDIDLNGIRYEAIVAENDAQRFAASKFLHQFIRHPRVEAGDEGVLINEEYSLGQNRLAQDRQGQVHAPIAEHLEQQILREALRLDVIDSREEAFLIYLIGALVDVLHVGCVHFEYPETDITIPVGMTFVSEQITSSCQQSVSRNVSYCF